MPHRVTLQAPGAALPSASAFVPRVEQLLGQLSLSEKVSLMDTNSPGIDRLGVPAFNW